MFAYFVNILYAVTDKILHEIHSSVYKCQDSLLLDFKDPILDIKTHGLVGKISTISDKNPNSRWGNKCSF